MKAFLVKKSMELCGSLAKAVEVAWSCMDASNRTPIVTPIYRRSDYEEYRVYGIGLGGKIFYRTIEAVELDKSNSNMEFELLGNRW